MKINIGSYLENLIKDSKYSKKDICNELNKRYVIGDKPLSYTTFSNNLKEGNITLNEAIGLATILNVDLNKIVNVYKNKYTVENSISINSKLNSVVADIVKNETSYSYKDIICTEANVYPFMGDGEPNLFEIMYVSEDGNIAMYSIVHLYDYLVCGKDRGFLVEEAYFTNFLEILGESDMTLKYFNSLSAEDKLIYLQSEGESALAILGETAKEIEFTPSKYFNKGGSTKEVEISKTNKVTPKDDIKQFDGGGTIMDALCHSNSNIVVDYIMDNKDKDEFANVINNDKYNGNVDKYIDDVIYDWRNVAPFNTFDIIRFVTILNR